MRIVWLCNVPIPQVCEKFRIGTSPYGGWLEKAYEELSSLGEFEILFVYPDFVDKIERIGNFIRFPRFKDPSAISIKDISVAKEVLDIAAPEILHIFGSEMSHSLAFAEVFNKPNSTIVNIQGVMRDIADKYCNGIPKWETIIPTIAELLFRSGNIQFQKKKMQKRAINEYKLMNMVSYAVGRTTYDKSFVNSVTRHIQYTYCPESLRETFYTNSVWYYEKCEKNSIFMSQASYPIKGVHYLIKALSLVKKSYPSFKLYIGGDSLLPNSFKSYFGKSSYQRYVRRLINKNKLGGNIIFLGSLNAEQMKERYLRANVYVLPSIVENSPNSLGEAMMLGAPVIAANVGGVHDILGDDNESEYECTDIKHLADKILDVFNSGKIPENGREARIRRAREFFDVSENVSMLKGLYYKITN